MKAAISRLGPFLAPVMAALALAGCRPESPVIYAVYPAMGFAGGLLTIHGSFFGGERGVSYVTIAGAQPTGGAYEEWRDDMISLRVPEFGEAGLVFVHVEGRRSNGALFVNAAAMPRQAQGGRAGLGPAIDSVSPASGAVGSVVTISGSGFGNSRGQGAVFFSRSSGGAALGSDRDLLEVSEAEFGYEMWRDREIRVRVPDGAGSGRLDVRTARGRSPPAHFEVSGGPGAKTFVDRQSFIIAFSVNIETLEAEAPNALHLWVPFPDASAAQRNAELLFSSPEPFILEYMGATLYRLENLEAHSAANVNLSWAVDVYGVRTSVQPQAVARGAASPLRDAYVRACPRLPADDPRVRGLAASIIGGETNPYLQAGMIYRWMLENIAWEERVFGDVFYALENRRADAFLAAHLYSALLRSAGVPSRPVAGVLVGHGRQTANHYWAEFWLDGLGWIPADPVMGAGAVPPAFEFRADAHSAGSEAAEFFFGNLDSRRIAFSRGFADIPQMDPRGRAVTHERSYALQSPWEEAVGGLHAYTSAWGSIIITGMHAQ